MSAPASSGASAPAGFPRVSAWIWRSLAFAFLFLSFFRFLKDPAGDLDPSWRMAIDYLFGQGAQFGRDVVFTYGPLGLFMAQTYTGIHFGLHLAWALVSSVVFVAAVWWLVRPLSLNGRIVAVGFFGVFASIYADFLQIAQATALIVLLIRDARESRRLQPAVAVAMLAVLAAVKFTNLLLGGIGVAACVAFDLWEGRRKRATWVGGGFAGAFLATWLLAGQNPLNLPAYFLNSLQISQGYEDAMFLPATPALFTAGWMALAGLVAYGLLVLLTMTDRPRTLALGFVFGAGSYLQWKHGFVRADGHVLGFFLWVVFFAACFPALLADGDRWRMLKRPVVILLAFLGFRGIYLIFPLSVTHSVDNAAQTVRTAAEVLARLPGMRERLDQRFAREGQNFELPQFKVIAKDETVDVLGYEQGAALLNRLNYTPRPVFQSYSVYTPKLARLNRDFLASPRAPRWLLVRQQSLDNRYPTMDDGLAMRVVAERYDYVFTERAFHVFRLRPDAPAQLPAEPEPIRGGEARFGAKIDVADLADRSVWLSVEWDWTLAGRLRAFFFKVPEVQLEVTQEGGETRLFRLPRLLAGTGFQLNPLVEDNKDLLRYFSGEGGKRIEAFRVVTTPGAEWCTPPTFRYTLAKIPAPGRELKVPADPNRAKYPMFHNFPLSVRTPFDPARDTIDGYPVLMVHAPSELVFEVPRGAARLRARFGYVPRAYQGTGNTDGSTFKIVARDASGREQVLFERILRPKQTPADRGLQLIDVALPAEGATRLVFTTDTGPYGSDGWDWTCWADVEIR